MSTQSEPKKADIGLAAIAQAQAADGGGSNAATAQSPAVATGNIPVAAPGVVIATVSITPKFSGKFRVTIAGYTTQNANAAVQSVTPGIARSTTAPVVGTTPLNSDITLPASFAGAGPAGPSASVGAVYIDMNGITPSPIGVPLWISLTLFQSAVGAFAVAANGFSINAVEVP